MYKLMLVTETLVIPSNSYSRAYLSKAFLAHIIFDIAAGHHDANGGSLAWYLWVWVSTQRT